MARANTKHDASGIQNLSGTKYYYQVITTVEDRNKCGVLVPEKVEFSQVIKDSDLMNSRRKAFQIVEDTSLLPFISSNRNPAKRVGKCEIITTYKIELICNYSNDRVEKVEIFNSEKTGFKGYGLPNGFIPDGLFREYSICVDDLKLGNIFRQYLPGINDPSEIKVIIAI